MSSFSKISPIRRSITLTGGAFLLERNIMREQRIIKCPKCDSVVGKYYGKSKQKVISRCGNCRKQIIYDPVTWQSEIKPLPGRTCSSGMRY
jgi:hypothetical protein